jgi:hypothetical protein
MLFDSHISPDASSATTERVESEVDRAAVSQRPIAAQPEVNGQASEDEVVAAAPVWLQRLSLLVLVLFCVYLGVLVTILPWWTRIWDHNGLIQAHPMVAAVLHMGAVRGFISGLGLLDIWIGISEAIHYRDHRA